MSLGVSLSPADQILNRSLRPATVLQFCRSTMAPRAVLEGDLRSGPGREAAFLPGAFVGFISDCKTRTRLVGNRPRYAAVVDKVQFMQKLKHRTKAATTI